MTMETIILTGFLFFFTKEDCLTCHEQEIRGAHEKIECVDCHSDIKDLPHKTPLKKVKCGKCHEDIESMYKKDIHYLLSLKGKKTPDCKTCHGTHEILSPSNVRSPLHPSRKKIFCTKCHKNVIAPKVYHTIKIAEKECFECHDKEVRDTLNTSVHAVLGCSDCHREVKKIPHPEKLESPECGLCHKKEYFEHVESIHGRAIKEGVKEAAHCYDCHGSHKIVKVEKEESPVYYKNLPETCGRCHGKEEIAEKYRIPIRNPYQLYEESVHYYAILKGKKGAICSDCHGVHDIDVSTSPKSKINKYRIPETCSKCHKKEYEDYVESIHWKGYIIGVKESPVCNDCHSEHRILPPDNPESPIYPLNIPKTCSDCHERYILIQKYGLPGKRLSTFYESYHGLALKAGNLVAANCASCHENHRILRSDNPLSPVYPDNLPQTCGKCHPGIKSTAKIHSVHEQISSLGARVIDIVRKIYIYLIIITIGGMIVYCFLDFLKKAREGVRYRYTEEGREILRFNKFERALHLIHLISFIILVYTGFAHHYPDAVWASWIAKLGGGTLRGYLHRAAGVLIIAVFLIKVFCMIFTERGRKQFLELLLKPKDIKDAILLLFYNLGLSSNKPKFGRFTFYEKFEYWALVWGTFVMGITGIALWFKNQSLNYVPKWVIDLFLVVHFYEAILASLAILVWHLYWVVFDPLIYPINKSMFTGKLPEEIYEEEHPLELKRE